jgi:hypothetical protein
MKKGQAWVDVRKLYQRAWKIYINMAAPVLFKLFLAQTHNTSLSGERTTWSTAEPFIKWPLLWWRAPKKSAATEIPDVLQAIWFPEFKNILRPTGGSEFNAVPADRPGAWFPGPLGPYLTWLPAI